MLGAFSLASNLLQNTVGLHDSNCAVAHSIATKEEHLRALRERNRELAANKAFLQSEAGVLAAVRPLGFGRPGERRVMFEENR